MVAIEGSSGANHVYVSAGASVDAATVFGGDGDAVYLTGNFSDYDQKLDESGQYIFSRVAGLAQGQSEVIKVQPGWGSNWLYFANGRVALNYFDAQPNGRPPLVNEQTGVFRLIAAADLVAGSTPAAFPTGIPRVSGPTPANWLWADGRTVNSSDWPGLADVLNKGSGAATFTTPALDPQNKTGALHSGVPGVFAFIKGF